MQTAHPISNLVKSNHQNQISMMAVASTKATTEATTEIKESIKMKEIDMQIDQIKVNQGPISRQGRIFHQRSVKNLIRPSLDVTRNQRSKLLNVAYVSVSQILQIFKIYFEINIFNIF